MKLLAQIPCLYSLISITASTTVLLLSISRQRWKFQWLIWVRFNIFAFLETILRRSSLQKLQQLSFLLMCWKWMKRMLEFLQVFSRLFMEYSEGCLRFLRYILIPVLDTVRYMLVWIHKNSNFDYFSEMFGYFALCQDFSTVKFEFTFFSPSSRLYHIHLLIERLFESYSLLTPT